MAGKMDCGPTGYDIREMRRLQEAREAVAKAPEPDEPAPKPKAKRKKKAKVK